MFCITVYQGNNAYSWNTTERSHPGSLIASPPTFNSPRVGASNPASRLSNVVFPHPLGPTIEKNSFFTTWKFTSSSASSGSPFMEQCTLLTCATSTWITLLLPSSREALLSDVPGHREACGLAHEIVERETENSDQHHAEQDVVAAEQRSSVVDHVAESAGCCHQLACDQRHPPDAETDADPGENLWQCRRQHDREKQRPPACAEAQPRSQQIGIDITRACERIQHDGEKRREEDDVHDLHVANAEPENAQGNPGQRRNGPDEFDQRIDHRANSPRPAHGKPQRNTEQRCDTDREDHAVEAVENMREQHAATDQVDGRGNDRGGGRKHDVELRIDALPENAHELPDDKECREKPKARNAGQRAPPSRLRWRYHRGRELRHRIGLGQRAAACLVHGIYVLPLKVQDFLSSPASGNAAGPFS